MQFGFSSYSFYQRLRTGDMTMFDVIDWVAASEGEHLEIATVSLSQDMTNDTSTLVSDPDFVAALGAKARAAEVPLSNLVIPANFLTDTPEDYEREMRRVQDHIRVADALDIRLFRHDVVTWAHRDTDIADYERCLPIIVDACGEIARFAAGYGITTSVENHGNMVNASERVRRLIHLVDEPNFRTTLDVGNFLVVDEDPVSATMQNMPYASIVHLKDFYIRPVRQDPGPGWLTTAAGNHLLGSIVGYGDMDMRGVLGAVAASGFDGYVSIEFEGIEDCLLGAERGLANTLRILAEIR
ncbi:sugar phosphate isomerase/epimerase [Nakamurella flavida]|uniref:Sugar phosphate isomerase/epimerase n=1 Tax=Nakamurella flavida TaxID=363630 RepID=A0A939C3Y0_9ACTN|nr:sugar phosphate isomerase/epimerase family protein [Nakamurella flavida]MBM9478155.1 sugar phosphate isomerase/epimerase [Nakamurella flavida]MDP9778623.1 sugar phosphate isomerase/epimerase [Nakamurella flavida]